MSEVVSDWRWVPCGNGRASMFVEGPEEELVEIARQNYVLYGHEDCGFRVTITPEDEDGPPTLWMTIDEHYVVVT